MVATFVVLLVAAGIAAPTYSYLAVKEIRPGYKLRTVAGIIGAFTAGLLAVNFHVVSLDLYLYFLICITVTAILITRGRPAALFDWAMIYGFEDPEAEQHDKGIWKRQAAYVALLFLEGAPAVYLAAR